jgi:hypothetical protein
MGAAFYYSAAPVPRARRATLPCTGRLLVGPVAGRQPARRALLD